MESVETQALRPGKRTLAAANGLMFWFGVSIFLFTFIAFALKVVVHPVRLERYSLPVSIHGLAMMAWIACFTVQAWYISQARTDMHRRLGILSVALVLVLLATGVPILFASAREFGDPVLLLGNGVIFGYFTALYIAAVLAALTHRFETHKRFMLIATMMFMLQPAGRMMEVAGLPGLMAPLPVLVAVVVLPAWYDLVSRGRPHPATFAGWLIYAGMIATIFGLLSNASILEGTQAWLAS